MTPHPRTIASINLQGERTRPHNWTRYTIAPCSCYVPDDPDNRMGWNLCSYHEGFDDACKEATQ